MNELKTFRQRMDYARELSTKVRSGSKEAIAELDELRQGNKFHQSLYLRTILVGGPAEGAYSFVSNTSRVLSYLALNAICRFGENDAITEVLKKLPFKRRKQGIILLRKNRKQSAIDAYFASGVVDKKDVNLLPSASREVVSRYLDRLRESSEFGLWTLVAKKHPQIANDECQRIIELDSQNYILSSRFAEILRVFLRTEREFATQLAIRKLRKMGALGYLDHGFVLYAQSLLSHNPKELFGALQEFEKGYLSAGHEGIFGRLSFDSVVHRLTSDQRSFLIEHYPSSLSSDLKKGKRWLDRLSQDEQLAVWRDFELFGKSSWGAHLFHIEGVSEKEKRKVWERWSKAAQDKKGIINHNLIKSLPANFRKLEGLRHLHEVSDLIHRLVDRSAYGQWLDYDIALKELDDCLSHPDGEMRRYGYGYLVASIENSPEKMGELFGRLKACVNEQDTVRLAITQSLSELQASVLRLLPKDELAELFDSYLTSSDLSYASLNYMTKTLKRMLIFDTRFASEQLGKVMNLKPEATWISYDILDNLTHEQKSIVLNQFSAVWEKWKQSERYPSIIALSRAMGDSVRKSDELKASLRDIVKVSANRTQVGEAFGILSKYGPVELASFMPELIEKESGLLAIQQIAEWASRYRQDRLQPLFDGKPLKGRFVTGLSTSIIFIERHINTWSEGDQSDYQRLLQTFVRSDKVSQHEACQAISVLAKFCFLNVDCLKTLADDERDFIQELAVKSLGKVDDAQTIEVLSKYLGDARARHAIYSMRRLIARLDESRVCGLLKAMPMDKVTVAKEVCRLLGDFGGNEGLEMLISMSRTKLHNDVMVAVVRGLWNFTDNSAVWETMENLAEKSNKHVLTRIVQIPFTSLTKDLDEKFCSLFLILLSRAEPDILVTVLQRYSVLGFIDADSRVFKRVADLTTSRDKSIAKQAITSAMSRVKPEEMDLLKNRYLKILKRPRRAKILAEVACFMTGIHARELLKEQANFLIEHLSEDPLMVADCLRLAATNGYSLGLWESLAEKGWLHPDAIGELYNWAGALRYPERVEPTLRVSGHEALRSVGLRLLERIGNEQGWGFRRLLALKKYRGDSSLWIRTRATFLFE